MDVRNFSHLVLRVADLDASLHFYRDVVGLEVVLRIRPDDAAPEGSIAAGLNIAGCQAGGTVLELVEGLEGAADASYVVALNVPDVRAAARQLEEAGIAILMPPTEVTPGVTMLFVRDPDGRQIEFVEFASGATSSAENLAKTA